MLGQAYSKISLKKSKGSNFLSVIISIFNKYHKYIYASQLFYRNNIIIFLKKILNCINTKIKK